MKTGNENFFRKGEIKKSYGDPYQIKNDFYKILINRQSLFHN